ncbi:hypothetical protein BKA67DRAFT_661156 [Truncatella angustata]|uniref:Uncharacterized protein n=1 Tax=Truncatella angustata TaxID=152316 RepID=A0A9P8UHZ0_9PEZI|nr:uncharacterized protein BKA67DRAFT_661156 [Truncatella angustata]KAH6652414.1 hypothetical protein BKA67DRAFT_661156 [Truncatella angustata]
MFEDFSVRHLPALYVGFAFTFGGIWPLFSAPSSLRAFGFPARIRNSPAAWPVMGIYGSRTSIIGILIYTFYFQHKYTELDTILTIIGTYAGFVDTYIITKATEGSIVHSFYRLIPSLALGAYGYYGLTSGRLHNTMG